MRILVTGSRDWPTGFLGWCRVGIALHQAAGDTPRDQVTVVHGDARGADTVAHEATLTLGFHPEPHYAQWDVYGKAAGPIRNQEMVDAGADVCLAFYATGAGNRGTQDCVDLATAAGIPVTKIGDDGVV